MLWTLARAGVSILSPHTAFDNTAGGINDGLARRLGLVDVGAAAARRPPPATFKVVVFTPGSGPRGRALRGLRGRGRADRGVRGVLVRDRRASGRSSATEGTNPTVGQAGRRETVARADGSRWSARPTGSRRSSRPSARRTRTRSRRSTSTRSTPSRGGPGAGRVGRLTEPTTLGDVRARASRRSWTRPGSSSSATRRGRSSGWRSSAARGTTSSATPSARGPTCC